MIINLELNPDKIITLNDYPVHSESVLSEYFSRCKLGKELPLVPVIRKDFVKRYLDQELLGKFQKFEDQNPAAEYFMLDGNHRTTALTLAGSRIRVVLYEKDEDITATRRLVATGQIIKDDILNHTLEENCEILNRHFKEKPSFMTVEQKTRRMVQDRILPPEIAEFYGQ